MQIVREGGRESNTLGWRNGEGGAKWRKSKCGDRSCKICTKTRAAVFLKKNSCRLQWMDHIFPPGLCRIETPSLLSC